MRRRSIVCAEGTLPLPWRVSDQVACHLALAKGVLNNELIVEVLCHLTLPLYQLCDLGQDCIIHFVWADLLQPVLIKLLLVGLAKFSHGCHSVKSVVCI